MKINELYPEILSEDRKVEFKEDLSQETPVKWAKTIVAFANGEGGYIFVGVSDDREAFGHKLDKIDRLKNLVYQTNDRNIIPHAKISFTLRSVDKEAEHFVLGIKVDPSDSLVKFREGDFNETVYVKGDGNTLPASPEDIVSLARRKFGIDEATTEDKYDPFLWSSYLALAREYREDGSEPSLKELQSEEIVDGEGYVKSGFLLFRDDYKGDDTRIHLRLWKGLDKSGFVLDSAKYKGPVGKCFMAAMAFIERNTRSGWEKTAKGGRKELRSYPREAVREALVNAIAHRDYSILGTQIDVDIFSDRIDITSPGSWMLPREYEEYDAGTIPSIRRNRMISAILDVANLMERGGTGFATIISSYKDAEEAKQPSVTSYPGFLRLRLHDLQYEEKKEVKYFMEETPFYRTDEMKRVLSLLEDGPKGTRELMEGSSYRSRNFFLSNVVTPLLEEGAIRRIGKEKSPTSVFVLTKLS